MAVLVEGDCFAYAAVGKFFYLAYFLIGEFLEMREVKSKDIGRYERAFLLHVCTKHIAKGLVQKVCSCVVARCSHACLGVDSGMECVVEIGGQFFYNVYCNTVFALGIDYLGNSAGGSVDKLAPVAYLTAHFGIEGSLREDNLIVFAVFLFYVAVAKHLGIAFGSIVAYKFFFAIVHDYPVGCLYGGCGAGTLFLCLHFHIESGVVNSHTVVFEDKLGKVEGETVSIVECKCLLARDFGLAFSLGGLDSFVE